MRLTFGLEVERCPNCAGKMKLRALVHEPESIGGKLFYCQAVASAGIMTAEA